MSAHDFELRPFDGAAVDAVDDATRRRRMTIRIAVAAGIVLFAIIAECFVMVPADEAVVISRRGNPVRVLTKPGLGWKLPAPIETTVPIDLRLRTTSTGLQDVGTREFVRVLLQTYTAW